MNMPVDMHSTRDVTSLAGFMPHGKRNWMGLSSVSVFAARKRNKTILGAEYRLALDSIGLPFASIATISTVQRIAAHFES